jgi:hypothetical protein
VSTDKTDRDRWRVGVRVSRGDGSASGTIIEADGELKIRWDSGRTSYYRRKVPTDIRAIPTPDE